MLVLDRYNNHIQTSPYRGSTLHDLIYVSQVSNSVPSDNDDDVGDPLRACGSLSGEINLPLVHSPLPKKYLQFIDGVLTQSHPGMDDTD